VLWLGLLNSGVTAQSGPSSRLEVIANLAFAEGPVYHPDGVLYFTDIANDRIMRLRPETPPGTVGRVAEVFRYPSGKANGLALDSQGRLIACEGGDVGGRRQVTRTERDGSLTVLASHYKGKRLNSPNDLTLDQSGRIYFTDPRYGDRTDMEMSVEGVYRIDPDGSMTRIIEELERPNGIAVSPDGTTLFVVDNNNERGGARMVWAYPLEADGSVGEREPVHDFGSGRGGDGVCVDMGANLFVTAGLNAPNQANDGSVPAGVYVFGPRRQLLEFFPVGEDMITNCAFGGPDGRTLFVTAGKSVLQVQRQTPGYFPSRAVSN